MNLIVKIERIMCMRARKHEHGGARRVLACLITSDKIAKWTTAGVTRFIVKKTSLERNLRLEQV